MYMSLSKLYEIVKDKEAWCAAVHRISKSSVVAARGLNGFDSQALSDS